jgi:L-lactate utilization protein LutC
VKFALFLLYFVFFITWLFWRFYIDLHIGNTFMVLPQNNTVNIVVSAKIPKELKEKAMRYGVKLSQTFRDALEQKINEIERKEKADKVRELRKSIGKVDKSDVVKAVRASRDER